MQSTHNTISSLIAIKANCHGYNTTYAHKGVSFESALQDAFIQMKADSIQNALVGAHDELTPAYFTLLKKAEYMGMSNQTFASETAVAMILSNEKTENALCEIEAVEKYYCLQNIKKVRKFDEIDAVMVGTNGVEETDKIYLQNCAELFPNIPLLQYKNIFGEGYTTPALGVYAAALCLQKGIIPEHLKNYPTTDNRISRIKRILCYNQFENKNHTFVLLSKN